MKKEFRKQILLPILMIISSSAFASKYEAPHDIYMNYGTQAECEADGNTWTADSCVAHTNDSVEITKVGRSYKVVVETMSSNAHSCSFEAVNGRFIKPYTLVSSADSMIYDQNGKQSPATCTVTVTFKKGQKVSVKQSGMEECMDFCGVNAQLDIEGAKRVR